MENVAKIGIAQSKDDTMNTQKNEQQKKIKKNYWKKEQQQQQNTSTESNCFGKYFEMCL